MAGYEMADKGPIGVPHRPEKPYEKGATHEAYPGHADLDGQSVAELLARRTASFRDFRGSELEGTP